MNCVVSLIGNKNSAPVQTSLRHPYGFWNPAMTQQRPNAYIVTPPMSTFYLEGKLMRVIQVPIKECPRPTSDHVQLAGPPRRNDNKVTLTLEISPTLLYSITVDVLLFPHRGFYAMCVCVGDLDTLLATKIGNGRRYADQSVSGGSDVVILKSNRYISTLYLLVIHMIFGLKY